ncbi:MAG: DNA-processing protein DprA, partial [Bdellovibrionales bacterium]|nr:DNA-processing protein DprA [Bdellovibrionales bacterium]
MSLDLKKQIMTLGWCFNLKDSDFEVLQQVKGCGGTADLSIENALVDLTSLSRQRVKDKILLCRTELDRLDELGAGVLTHDSSFYPAALRQKCLKPPVLSYIGNPSLLQSFSFGVVGSRKMSTQSETWLEQSLPFVFQKIEGCATLVSGGAIGVDQHAHKIALRCGANSIAVLPTGLTQTYPASFTELTEAFLDRGGLLVSPFRPTQRVRKSLFASRNFVLVNLVKLLFVVQAEKRSGSYLSAQVAVDSGV